MPDSDHDTEDGVLHAANPEPPNEVQDLVHEDQPPTPNGRTVVNRKLKSIHILMITINATLGTGLYWRGGQILELGGSLAVALSFVLVGLLAWAVMQGLSEMLCIWPIPGAFSVYVREFVDAELGIAIGIAYWFSYSIAFAALVAAAAAEIQTWIQSKVFDGLFMYLAIPTVLILINSLSVKWYGWFEVVMGSSKMAFLLVIIISLIVFLAEGVGDKTLFESNWKTPLTSYYDKDVAQDWGAAFIMSLTVATYAYVGVEVVAVTSLEAETPAPTANGQERLLSNTVRRTAIWTAPLAMACYVFPSVLATFLLEWDDCQLPRLGWSPNSRCRRGASDLTAQQALSQSSFVAIARAAGRRQLADLFTAFLLVTALTCANTMLYVASRTLFGMTRGLIGGPDTSSRLTRFMAYFGQTTKDSKVPVRAVVASALAFSWVPFLQLAGPNDGSEVAGVSGIGRFIDTLGGMDCSAVVIVWACCCVAYLRFYYSIRTHRAKLQSQNYKHVLRWGGDEYEAFPYRSPTNPVAAWIGLGGCVFILLGAGGASFSRRFDGIPFASTYLVIIVFVLLWVLLKWKRGTLRRAWIIDLDNPAVLEAIIDKLNAMRNTTSIEEATLELHRTG